MNGSLIESRVERAIARGEQGKAKAVGVLGKLYPHCLEDGEIRDMSSALVLAKMEYENAASLLNDALDHISACRSSKDGR